MNILVTGANGQVGMELQKAAPSTTFTFVFTDKDQLDITNPEAVNHIFEEHNFDYCINCAAYTAVDKAEEDNELADRINHIAVKNLAAACVKQGTRLIQISTDYVYHNSQNRPFVETDVTNPQGVYAATKLAGDNAALAYTNAIVIRTSWVYSSFGHNFVKTMLRLGTERDRLTVIFDQIGSPTYAEDLALAMLQIIAQNPTHFSGIYHYSNEGVCSWFDFAKAIFDLKGISCQVSPIETKDYPTPAKRPHFSLLNKAKIKSEFNIKIPYWRDSLERCLQLL